MNLLLTVAQTVADHADVWAAPEPTPTGDPAGEIDTAGIVGWIAKFIVPVIFGFLGVITMARAARGNVSQTMTTSMIAIIGAVMLAAAGTLFFFGDNLADLAFK